MDFKPKLSLCIPTWNRSIKLNQLLLSIVNQPELDKLKDDLEIVISDNGSIDSTPLLAEFYRKESPIKINYARLVHNRRFDINVCNVIDSALGEYVWLLGDDDAVTYGAINTVMEAIQSNHEAYIGDCWWCEEHLLPLAVANWYIKGLEKTEFDLKKDMAEWLSYLENDGACFGFISTMIFKRNIWKPIPEWMGNAFIHRSLIGVRPTLKLIRSNIAAMRGDCRYEGPNTSDNHPDDPRDTFGMHVHYLKSWGDIAEILTEEEVHQLWGMCWRHMASWFALDWKDTQGIMFGLFKEARNQYEYYENAVPKLKRLFKESI